MYKRHFTAVAVTQSYLHADKLLLKRQYQQDTACLQLAKASALRWHRQMFITHSHFCYDIQYTAKEDTQTLQGMK